MYRTLIRRIDSAYNLQEWRRSGFGLPSAEHGRSCKDEDDRGTVKNDTPLLNVATYLYMDVAITTWTTVATSISC